MLFFYYLQAQNDLPNWYTLAHQYWPSIAGFISVTTGLLAIPRTIRGVKKAAEILIQIKRGLDVAETFVAVAEKLTPDTIDRLVKMAEQFRPNGGDSMFDRLTRIEMQLLGLQSRLNVMNLTAGSADDQLAALERFDRLFEQLGLPSQELGALQRALARAQQAMTRTPPEGDAPLLPTRFDQLAWLGLSAPTLERLRPYVTVLPLQNGRATPVNLNTASATVIQAAIPGLDRALAERLVSLRAQQRFTSVAQAMTALERSKLDSGWAAVSSSFFEIRGRLRLDDVALEEVAVVPGERAAARAVQEDRDVGVLREPRELVGRVVPPHAAAGDHRLRGEGAAHVHQPPARVAAVSASAPSCSRMWFAYSTSRIEFFFTIPMRRRRPIMLKRLSDLPESASPAMAPAIASGMIVSTVTGCRNELN